MVLRQLAQVIREERRLEERGSWGKPSRLRRGIGKNIDKLVEEVRHQQETGGRKCDRASSDRFGGRSQHHDCVSDGESRQRRCDYR